MSTINDNQDYDKVAQLLIKRGAIETICENLLKNGKNLSEENKTNFVALLRSQKGNFARFVSTVSKICSVGEFNEDAFSWLSRGVIGHYVYTFNLSLPANRKFRNEVLTIASKENNAVERLKFMSNYFGACSVQFYAAKDKSDEERCTNDTFHDICLLCIDEVGKHCAVQAMRFFDSKIPKKTVFAFLESLRIQTNSPEMCKMIEDCFESPTMTIEVTEYNSVAHHIKHYSIHKNTPNGEVGASEAALEFIERHLSEFSIPFLEALMPKCERRLVSVEGGFPFNLEECYVDPLIYSKERLKYLIKLKG